MEVKIGFKNLLLSSRLNYNRSCNTFLIKIYVIYTMKKKGQILAARVKENR